MKNKLGRTLFSFLLATATTAVANLPWDADTFQEMNANSYGTLFYNLIEGPDDLRDAPRKRLKIVRYGEVSIVPFRSNFCVYATHFDKDFSYGSAKATYVFKRRTFFADPSKVTQETDFPGTFTSTPEKGSGQYPSYCFDWPEGAVKFEIRYTTQTGFTAPTAAVLQRR